MSKKHNVTFSFDSDEARDHFVSWLSGSGEQQYWEWMDMRESEQDGDITALRFRYGWPSPDYTKPIVAECGRMDARDWEAGSDE